MDPLRVIEIESVPNEPGWPRPRNKDGFPIPWVSVPNDLGVMIPDRIEKCRQDLLCQVCAEQHDPDDDVYLFVQEKPPTAWTDVLAQAMDDGVLHRRCALLSRARCPELVRLDAKSKLEMLKCKAHQVYFDHGIDGMVVSLSDCEVVT